MHKKTKTHTDKDKRIYAVIKWAKCDKTQSREL